MTVAASTPSKSKIRKLLRQLQMRNHEWGKGVFIHRDMAPLGCEETERVCEHCHLVKITVHPPFGRPYRVWRTRGGIRIPNTVQMPWCED